MKPVQEAPVYTEQPFIFRPAWSSPRYHTGSLAFGSLILSSLQTFKIIIEYLDRRLKSKLAEVILDFRAKSGVGWGAGYPVTIVWGGVGCR